MVMMDCTYRCVDAMHAQEGVVQRFGQGIIDQVLQEGSATVRGKKGSWVLTR